MKIYIVYGETGEYSDRRDWPVLAYTDEALAEAHVLMCEEWLRVQRCHYGSSPVLDYTERDALVNPHDVSGAFSVDYTGTRYFVVNVECAQ